MFNSDKEADKFIRAKLNCVSGLRGILKNSIGKNGDFRATFEGSILPSNFIKCFIPIHLNDNFKYLNNTDENEDFDSLESEKDSIEDDSSKDSNEDEREIKINKSHKYLETKNNSFNLSNIKKLKELEN